MCFDIKKTHERLQRLLGMMQRGMYVLQGSLYGDSQLIRLQADAVDPAQPSNFVEVMDVWTNLGPIIDLAVVDLERQGQGQVVTCSGKGPDSSPRIVRNGIGMIEQAAVELAGQC